MQHASSAMKKKKETIVFLLSAEQWLGVLLFILIAGSVFLLLHRFQPKVVEPVVVTTDSMRTTFAVYQAQQDSLRKAKWKKQYARDTIAICMQQFDPNTADSSTLVHLGLKPWQASNMLKYRAKGGRYRKTEDLKRLYGMTDSMYLALLPYVVIDTLAIDRWRDSVRMAADSVPRYVSHKRDTILNLRTADTTELKMIKGIGSYRAKQIIRYREQLGGFVSVEQLREVKALQPLLKDSLSTDSLLSHFFIDSVRVVPLKVNSMRVERLQRHPYLSFEQARAIYELRRKKIHLKHLDQLRTLDCLTEQDIQRLRPYLSFEQKQKL